MDSDFLLAKKLQKLLDEEEINNKKSSVVHKKGDSIVDPQWEIFDPNPDIYTLFQVFNAKFFWNELGSVEVKWSPRMYSCAGVCTYKGRQGCVVSLSLPLLKLRPRKDLVETLLHEMIHAYLFVTDRNSEREEHGPKFHSHMYRINKAAGTNITVYHTFHDEVKHYKTHWWRCNGSCRFKPPFYGLVKRSMNRAPGPNDFWFGEHQATCGGEFIKVKEPEGFKARNRTKGTTVNKETSGKQQNLDKYLSPTQPCKKIGEGRVIALNSSNKNEVKTTGKLGTSNNVNGFTGLTPSNVPKSKTNPNANKIRGGQSGFKANGIGLMSNRGGTLLEKQRTISSTPTGPKNTNVKSPSFRANGMGLMSNRGGTLLDKQKTLPSTSTSPKNTNVKSPSFRANGMGLMSNRGSTLLEKQKTLPSTSTSPKNTNVQSSSFVAYSGTGHVLNPNCKSSEINRENSTLLKLFSKKENIKKPSIVEKTTNIEKTPNLEKNKNPSKKPKLENCSSGPCSSRDNLVENPSRIVVNCPVCNEEVSQGEMNEHLDLCINLDAVMDSVNESVIDVDEEENENITNENVNCSVCNEEVSQGAMNEHLDLCINLDAVMDSVNGSVIGVDEEENKNITNENVNCPNCDKLCNINVINQHLDECLQNV